MKINKNEIKTNFNNIYKSIFSEITSINEGNMPLFIGENSQKILDNTLKGFTKEDNYINIHDDIFKKDIFYFSSFINSCKKYEKISELKEDIKIFFQKKNDDIEYHYHIIYNYIKETLRLISFEDFFDEKENIKFLLKILRRYNKNLKPDSINNNKYIDIKQNIVNVYRDILNIFKKNNKKEKNKEKINSIIEELNNNLIIYEKSLYNNDVNLNIINKSKSDDIVYNAKKVYNKEEIDNLMKRMALKVMDLKRHNNLEDEKIISNKNH